MMPYDHARYFDQALGRFLSVDRTGGDVLDPSTSSAGTQVAADDELDDECSLRAEALLAATLTLFRVHGGQTLPPAAAPSHKRTVNFR